MNIRFNRRTSQHLLLSTLTALSAALLVAGTPAVAGPGAHGPNGEHLDAPGAVRTGSALPRIEAQSDAFELVAELRGGELVIVVDRYESNEPVLGAKLAVESGALKAVAAFRGEQGDYVVSDAAMLKVLAAPGEHALVFTLVAGKDSDLLDGTLVTAGKSATTAAASSGPGHDHGDADHGHDHALERAAWTGAAVAALGLVGAVAWWRQRRRGAGASQGAL